LTEPGQLDPSFGGGDGVSGPIEDSTSVPALELDGDGAAVVGVGRINSRQAECEPGTTLYRFRQNGGRMKSFGSGGVRVFTRLHLAFVEPSGAMILSRRAARTLRLVRIAPDGSRDMGFGRHGVAEAHLPAGLHVRPVAVDARGRILLAGFVGSPSGSTKKGKPKHSSFVVARLLPDGRPDSSFGSRGWIFTGLPRPLEITGARATLDPQGRLLVAGTVVERPERAAAFAVARYVLGPLESKAAR
jgi:uncharacterized delta-60 repeat protein